MNRTQKSSTLGKLILTTLLGSGLLLGAASQVLADGSRAGNDQQRWEERQQRHDDRDEHRGSVQARQDHHAVVIRELPRQARQVRVGKDLLYRDGDHFYSRRTGGFVRIDPPAGVIVASLPGGFIRIDLNGSSYFRCGDVYYRPVHSGYLVVDPVVGDLSRPHLAKTVRIAATRLNVRSGPGRNFAIIGRVRFGELLPVTGAAPSWHRVELANGRSGWILSRYTRSLPAG